MELALLVYAVSLLEGITAMGTAGIVFSICLAVCALLYLLCMYETTHDKQERLKQWKTAKRIWWSAFGILLLCGVVKTITPTEKTAYVMIGAYATQQIATNSATVEVGGKVLKIINQKLDTYVADGEKAVAKAVGQQEAKK